MFKLGQSCNGCPEDLNQDGMVDDTDLLLVMFNYGLQIGGLSWEYSYDVWGNLERAESNAVGLYQAAYDGFGRRAWQEINGVRTYFVYDGDTIVAELDANGNPVVEYAWGLLGPIARLDLTNPSNNRYYILDALGHTRLLLDNAGNTTDTYVYDAWGNLLKGSDFTTPNPFTWNGAYSYEWIEFTGLFHVGAREYDPRTARWLQRDPIGVGGGHPNVYLYCGNEPVNGIDVAGTDWYDGDVWYFLSFASSLLKNHVSRPTKPVALICVGDTNSGWLSNWAVSLAMKRDVRQLRSEFEAAGYEVVVDWECTKEELFNMLQCSAVKGFAFVGHSDEAGLMTHPIKEDDLTNSVSPDELKQVLGGRRLSMVRLFSCYTGTSEWRDALVDEEGSFVGMSGLYNPILGWDMGGFSGTKHGKKSRFKAKKGRK